MARNCKFLIIILAIGFLMGTFNLVQGKGLPADVEKWLKENKIGPFQEDKVDYNALYQAAKKEGKVVVYSNSSRGPKSLALGWYDKYPEIKVEWNNLGTAGTIARTIKEQKAGIYSADVVMASDLPTMRGIMHPAHMFFPWVPPDLKSVIPRRFQEPLLTWLLGGIGLFYNFDTWPEKPPIDSWWDFTKPEWKGRLVIEDPRTNSTVRFFLTTVVLKEEDMAKDYQRVFGKPLKLTTPNAGYEWIKMVFANTPKLVRDGKEARYIGKPGQARPSFGVWSLARITDTDNPKYGNIKLKPHLDLKPKMGLLYAIPLGVAYKAPHPNGAKLMIRWLMGDEKGGAGITPWFTPGTFPTRSDIKGVPKHPFNPKLSWGVKDLNAWYMDGELAAGIWKTQEGVLEFINRQF
jgi:iron(III) transport system substrate-binding protein